jgi:hypothetical protein
LKLTDLKSTAFVLQEGTAAVPWVLWDGLLLLASLLHLAAPAVKQQLVQERGNLLLQLLYHVLLEDQKLGGKGVPVQHKLLLSKQAADLKALCKEGVGGCLDEDKVTSSLDTATVRELPPASLVLLTLQAMLCNMDPERESHDDVAPALLAGDWLQTRAGGFWTADSQQPSICHCITAGLEDWSFSTRNVLAVHINAR